MKKGFTLVELLVVVVVIAILMGIVMRFGNISVETSYRNQTVRRMQCLENALSGYYAAFGTYPPVRLHGSRNYYLRVSDHGIQNVDAEENPNIWGWIGSDGKTVTNPDAEKEAWEQVEAACESQPVACCYPYGDDYRDYVQTYSEALQTYAEQDEDGELTAGQKAVFAAGFDAGTPIGRFSSYRDKDEWQDIQLFKFGLLSFLLPRYLFMMEGPEDLFENYAQWTGNNQLPCDPLTGRSYTGSWKGLRKNATENSDLARVANIPSQAVCARWMANFEKELTCDGDHTFFGIDVRDPDDDVLDLDGDINSRIQVYSPGGFSQNSHSGQYILKSMTILDGWDRQFYYYSPYPYQSYVVWSAGPNGRTFPPWVPRESLGSEANRCVAYWTADDIVGLKR